MCGLLSSVSSKKIDQFDHALSHLRHRGPDQLSIKNQTFQGKHLSMGHSLLSFFDKNQSSQPYTDNNQSNYLLFNGQIYNYLEIRDYLEKKHGVAAEESDTSVVFHALKTLGSKAIELFDGMWSFVFIDLDQDHIIACRDPHGQKPLYYCTHINDHLYFSSEVTPLKVLLNDKVEIDPIGLTQFLHFDYIPAPRTQYKEIKSVLPGQIIESKFSEINLQSSTYYNPEEQLSNINTNYNINELRRILVESIHKTSRSKIYPLALSGGIDSFTLCHLTQKTLKSINYSVKFNSPSYSEQNTILKTCDFLKTDTNDINVSDIDIKIALNEIYNKIDIPIGDTSLIPNYFLTQKISLNHKFYLSGDGLDEILNGYNLFTALNLLKNKISRKFLLPLTQIIQPVVKNNSSYMPMKLKLSRFTRVKNQNPHLWLPLWMSNTHLSESNRNLGLNVTTEELFEPFLNVPKTLRNNVEKCMSYQLLRVYLPNGILMTRDRASQLNSVENRSPYLNKDVFNKLIIIPASHKTSQFKRRKKILFKINKKYPKHLLTEAKHGFASPISEHLINNSNTYEHIFNSNLKSYKNKWVEHLSLKQNNKSILWNLIIAHKMNLI